MKKKLVLNTTTSILYQVTVIICGLIVPRLILKVYGSNANGLIQSITQFLSVISFLELGVGAVIQSSLYKPLEEKKTTTVDLIVSSGEKFFKRIATILGVYVLCLMALYPFLVSDDFDWLYTVVLILALSVNTFSQYYFGIIDRLLLNSDQRGYIQYTSQTIAVILNAAVTAILINLNCSLQIVKLSTSIIYLGRAVVVRIYVNKYYSVNRKANYTVEPIKQKWNGIAQHIAAIVLENTDVIVLTFFSTLANVSIYSVYHMVIYGVKQLYQAASAGIQAAIGNLWAKKDISKLKDFFGIVEMSMHFSTVFLFTCTSILLQPFIAVYTNGISDVNYYQPLFGVLIVMAHGFHCIRFPYNMLILAAGHYKQTQKYYIIAAVLNVIVSVITVSYFGLVGVAFGTMAAMIYHSVWMIIYNSKNIICWPIKTALKQICLDVLLVCLIILSTSWLRMSNVSYLSWAILALKVAGMAIIVTILVSIVFCKGKVKMIVNLIRKGDRK